jgi:ATP-binding cassette subfamily F protein 3
MISCNNIGIHFGGRTLFDNVSFVVNSRDKIGLIGRNGSGKSTLMKILSGYEEPSAGKIIFPSYFKVGYLSQDPQIHSDVTVLEEAESALTEIKSSESDFEKLTEEVSNRTDYESEEYFELLETMSHLSERLKILESHSAQGDVEMILIGLGFTRKDLNRLVTEFSGGWQMRIELAKILINKPDCILLDEPTNHLDIESIRWLELFLKNYVGSVILVSHDRKFLDNICNRTIEITNQRIYDMPYKYSDFMMKRDEQRQSEVATLRNQEREIAQIERFVERFRSKASLASRVQSRVKKLEKMTVVQLEDVDTSTVNIRFPTPPRSGRLVVEVTNLSKSYDELNVLKGVDFALERGERAAFVGKNGEGKSTFSRILAGIESFEGNVKIGESVVTGYYAQHQATMLSGDSTVFEIIDNAATGEMRTQVRHLLGAFLFSGDDIYKRVKVLSGGEKSRLALAKLLLTPSNLLILDEPTNHLDMLTKDVLKSALMDYEGTLIVVSHDREFLEGLTDKTFEFKNRNVKEYPGDIEYYLTKTEIGDLNLIKSDYPVSKNDEVQSEDKTSGSQLRREKRKEMQRELGKIVKQIAALEKEIADLEEKMQKYDALFLDTEFFNNKQKYSKARSEYDVFANRLNKCMETWSNLSQSQEKLQNDINEN